MTYDLQVIVVAPPCQRQPQSLTLTVTDQASTGAISVSTPALYSAYTFTYLSAVVGLAAWRAL